MNQTKNRALIPLIILTNLFPLYGVIKYNWTIFSVVYIYWLEMLIVTGFLVLKIVFAQGDPQATVVNKMVLAIKFLFMRCGIFLFYLLFIVVFLGFLVTGREHFRNTGIWQTLTLQDAFYKITLLNFILFNLVEFLMQFIASNNYRQAKPNDSFIIFDAHMLVVHLVVVLGSFLYKFVLENMQADHRTAMLACVSLFVVIKIVVDIAKQNNVVLPDRQQNQYNILEQSKHEIQHPF
ncbi:MAG: DUF6498-containing protein [Chitinophagales bacterium]